MNGKETLEQKNDMIVFLDDVEEFVGFDGKPIGPFDKGQIVNLAKEVANILIEGGRAEKLEK